MHLSLAGYATVLMAIQAVPLANPCLQTAVVCTQVNEATVNHPQYKLTQAFINCSLTIFFLMRAVFETKPFL
jgi:hypothetical protein